MRQRALHIQKTISVILLMVFAIALTPFSILHHHEEAQECVAYGKKCTHKFHVHKHTDNCLICAAHFEKNYTHSESHYEVYQENKRISKRYPTVNNSFTELISLALRGPPEV